MKNLLWLWWDIARKGGMRALFDLPMRLQLAERSLRTRDGDLQRVMLASGENEAAYAIEKRMRERLVRQLCETRRGEKGVLSFQADELERLAMLAEQLGRTAEAVGRVTRHGWDRAHDSIPRTNRTMLEREIGKLQAVVDFMVQRGDLEKQQMRHWREVEDRAIPKFSRYQGYSPLTVVPRAQEASTEK